ncbi:6-phosphogluconolactonase [Candidatus Nomurabacteria bacterium]|nr:6-phosphogluconolactonase [Candidatus Nomurabacteria bacterium]
MNIELKTTREPEDVATLIASSILKQLKSGQHVLFFATGGSSIYICTKISKILREYPDKNLVKNLTVTLTDERYGAVGHLDSNWQQLMDRGFCLPEAKCIPVLNGEEKDATVREWNNTLNQELMTKGYKIGVFGVGADGHTAGILPESPAIDSEDFACGYDTPTFSRITITSKTIEKLDEAAVWVQGIGKWPIVENLLKENIPINTQPTQILKKVPLLTIFSDYNAQ